MLTDQSPHPPPPQGARSLTLADFDFVVPEHLIAQQPLTERDDARLLIRTPGGALKHCHVRDLTKELPSRALVILNDSKVFPSRIFGSLKSGGRVELFLLSEERSDAASSQWRALAKPLKKLPKGTELSWGLAPDEVVARVDERLDQRDGTAVVLVTFNRSASQLTHWLDAFGVVPLPPYIKRPGVTNAAVSPDRERYQTVFAREIGSVAAPTAGLHFTPALMDALTKRGVELATVCLHVGGGTFLPVKAEDLSQHVMHIERATVPIATLESIIAAKREGRPIIAVGTTTFRALESLYRRADRDPDRLLRLAEDSFRTDLFLRPEHAGDVYRPWIIDALFTNFHQPRSTLFMLVGALLGLEGAQRLYVDAMAAKYRLFSYGDASLLWL